VLVAEWMFARVGGDLCRPHGFDKRFLSHPLVRVRRRKQIYGQGRIGASERVALLPCLMAPKFCQSSLSKFGSVRNRQNSPEKAT
jgi:hypothetical protein